MRDCEGLRPRARSADSTMLAQAMKLFSCEGSYSDMLRAYQTRSGLERLRDLGDASRAEAARADADAAGGAVDERVDPLQVGALDALGLDVGVAHLVADQAALAANITRVRHD